MTFPYTKKLLQRSPLSEKLSKHGIVKSAQEIKAEICKFKLGNYYDNSGPTLIHNLSGYVKDVKCNMVCLHNKQVVNGIPRVLSKLKFLNSINLNSYTARS